jgi:hypothetical protein
MYSEVRPLGDLTLADFILLKNAARKTVRNTAGPSTQPLHSL